MYFRSPFPQDFAVALRAILALPSPDVKWCDINGEALSFVGPTVPATLVSKDAIRSIGRIRKYLTDENLKLLVNTLVISRLDYCNSILYGLSKRELDKLQRVHNTAARLITGTKQYDHVKPALQKLHWLPVESRIIFKVILITFKILHGLSPAYLSSLLQEYHPPRSLRSSSKSLLTVSSMNSVTHGQRAFSFCAPRLRNTLPDSLKNAASLSSFKSALKTFLFRKFYF